MAAIVLIAGLGPLAGGCATSMGELAQPASAPLVLNSALIDDTVAEVKPAVLVEQGSQPGVPMPVTAAAEPLPLPVDPAAPTVAAGERSEEPKGKLLSPEEKARVIAELEALAKSQQAGSAAGKPKCAEDTAMALEPEERLKRDSAGGEC